LTDNCSAFVSFVLSSRNQCKQQIFYCSWREDFKEPWGNRNQRISESATLAWNFEWHSLL